MALAFVSKTVPIIATQSSVVITTPGSIALGMLLFAQVSLMVQPNTVRFATPSGWTLIRADQQPIVGGSQYISTYYFQKIATSADVSASNFTFTPSASCICGGGIAVFSGENGNPISASALGTSGSISGGVLTYASTSITPSVNNFLIIGNAGYSINQVQTISAWAIGQNDPGGWTQLWNSNAAPGSNQVFMALAYSAVRSQSTSTNSFHFNITSNNTIGQNDVILAIAPTIAISGTETVSMTDSAKVNITISYIASEIVNMTDSVVTAASTAWVNLQKTTANMWNNLFKS